MSGHITLGCAAKTTTATRWPPRWAMPLRRSRAPARAACQRVGAEESAISGGLHASAQVDHDDQVAPDRDTRFGALSPSGASQRQDQGDPAERISHPQPAPSGHGMRELTGDRRGRPTRVIASRRRLSAHRFRSPSTGRSSKSQSKSVREADPGDKLAQIGRERGEAWK